MTTLAQHLPARLLCAAAVLLTACNALPVYHPAPGDATVSFVGMGKPSFCSNGVSYQLEVAEADGYRTAKVPVGQRLTLWSYMSFDGYQVISTCTPMLAFTPQTGSAYIINSGLSSGQCFIEVVREDKSRDTGVALEPSVTRPGC